MLRTLYDCTNNYFQNPISLAQFLHNHGTALVNSNHFIQPLLLKIHQDADVDDDDDDEMQKTIWGKENFIYLWLLVVSAAIFSIFE